MEVKFMNTTISVKILSICLGLIVLAIGAVAVFNVAFDTVFFAGILLACPLLHIGMMKSKKHKH